MFLKAKTLDDLLRQVFRKLLVSPAIDPSRGRAREIAGAMLRLENPRARLSRSESKGKVFSALGELLWYLSGSNGLKFIEYYVPRYREESDDGETVYGGYGPRFFDMKGHDQLRNVVDTLTKNPSSRRAVIQLFDAADISKRRKEIPCTCILQFMVRVNKLHMFAYMRSNDAYFGLPHDVFAFTMLQEIVARELGIEVGVYNHFVSSLHLYESNWLQAKQYLSEGWHSTSQMPPMPIGRPWRCIGATLRFEKAIRAGQSVGEGRLKVLAPYWRDLILLLKIYRASIDRRPEEVTILQSEMSTRTYLPYIQDRKKIARRPLKGQRLDRPKRAK